MKHVNQPPFDFLTLWTHLMQRLGRIASFEIRTTHKCVRVLTLEYGSYLAYVTNPSCNTGILRQFFDPLWQKIRTSKYSQTLKNFDDSCGYLIRWMPNSQVQHIQIANLKQFLRSPSSCTLKSSASYKYLISE